MHLRKRKSKLFLFLFSVVLIISGIGIIMSKYLYNSYLDKKEINKIQTFYEKQEKINTNVINDYEEPNNVVNEDYIAVIKVPKINLEKGLCSKNSSCNNLNDNVQILDYSAYPDEPNGNFVLAGHSGTGRNAYFNMLDKLTKEDEIFVIYDGFQYKYKVVNIYEIEKTGTANIIRNKEKNTLTLITCKNNSNKQIIIISELVERTGYNALKKIIKKNLNC